MKTVSRLPVYVLAFLVASVGGWGLFFILVFIYHGSLTPLDLGLSETARMALNIGLCLAFFFQHSCMIRKTYRMWLIRFVRPDFHGAMYAVASGMVLLAIVALWQESDVTLVNVQGLPRWVLRLLFLLATAGIFWGTFALGTFDVFGISPIWHLLGGTAPQTGPFVIRGPYRWVRHPLYFFMIVMIWSCPDLSLDRLVFNILWTIWIVIGTILEERDLVSAFGDDYRNYQESTPMLIPRGIRPVVDEYSGLR